MIDRSHSSSVFHLRSLFLPCPLAQLSAFHPFLLCHVILSDSDIHSTNTFRHFGGGLLAGCRPALLGIISGPRPAPSLSTAFLHRNKLVIDFRPMASSLAKKAYALFFFGWPCFLHLQQTSHWFPAWSMASSIGKFSFPSSVPTNHWGGYWVPPHPY